MTKVGPEYLNQNYIDPFHRSWKCTFAKSYKHTTPLCLESSTTTATVSRPIFCLPCSVDFIFSESSSTIKRHVSWTLNQTRFWFGEFGFAVTGLKKKSTLLDIIDLIYFLWWICTWRLKETLCQSILHAFRPTPTQLAGKETLGFLRTQKPLRLIRDRAVGGSRSLYTNTYSPHCHHRGMTLH